MIIGPLFCSPSHFCANSSCAQTLSDLSGGGGDGDEVTRWLTPRCHEDAGADTQLHCSFFGSDWIPKMFYSFGVLCCVARCARAIDSRAGPRPPRATNLGGMDDRAHVLSDVLENFGSGVASGQPPSKFALDQLDQFRKVSLRWFLL